MTCPYCRMAVYSEEGQEYRGRWLVHKVCQLAGWRRGAYLLPNGDLAVGGLFISAALQPTQILAELREAQELRKRRMEAASGG